MPIELERKEYWAIRTLNFDLKVASNKWLQQLNDLDELCLEAYESLRICKERPKHGHDEHIMKK